MKYKLLIPAEDLDVNEIKSLLVDIDDVQVEDDLISNSTADIVFAVISNSINLSLAIIAFMQYRENKLANRKVEIYDENDNRIKVNIRLKDVNRFIDTIEHDQESI